MSTKVSAKDEKNFEATFDGLKLLLTPYEKQLRITADEPGNYMTMTQSANFKGKPLMFAAVMTKSYVAFHFFPVYMFPDLLNGISPELKKRMQGKTCWNFKKTDEKLFDELGRLVEAGFRRFESAGYL